MIHATTILAVRHQDRTVLAGDGQVTLGNTVVKQGARKIRRLYNESILAGFAGSAADSFALFSRFESKLEQYRGNLERSAVELARDWRSDRLLRRLEAMMIVADRKSTFLLSGTGDLIEPDDGIVDRRNFGHQRGDFTRVPRLGERVEFHELQKIAGILPPN